MPSLQIFDTHPIQYRSPLFRYLHQRVSLQVTYFSNAFDGSKFWFHEVGTIPKQTWETPLLEGFSHRFLESARFTRAASIWRQVRDAKGGAVLCFGYFLPEHWWVWLACVLQGVPLIFIGETSSETRGLRGLIKRPLRALFLRGVSQFVSIGNQNRDYYLRLGVSAERIFEGRYAVESGFFLRSGSAKTSVRESWRKKHGISIDDFVVLFVGRLFDRKRPFDILKLAGGLPSGRHRFVMIGNGPLEESLREEVSRSRLGDRVQMLGFQNQGETRDAYCGADCLVVPSEYETWGLVINEASLAGTPCLVTQSCGAALDLVIPGQTGEVFQVGNVSGARKILEQWESHRDQCQQLGSSARQRALHQFDIPNLGDPIVAAVQAATRGASASEGSGELPRPRRDRAPR